MGKKTIQKDAFMTSYLLEQLNRWSVIMTKSSFKNIEEFEVVVPFLEEFAVLIDQIKFKTRIKHQVGAVWSTKELMKRYFSMGMRDLRTSQFLQDPLEKVFSQTDAAAMKPSALQFLYALRAVTINQGMLHPVAGSS